MCNCFFFTFVGTNTINLICLRHILRPSRSHLWSHSNTLVTTMDPNSNTLVTTMDPNSNTLVTTMDPNSNTLVTTMDPNSNTLVTTMDPKSNTPVTTMMDPKSNTLVTTMDPFHKTDDAFNGHQHRKSLNVFYIYIFSLFFKCKHIYNTILCIISPLHQITIKLEKEKQHLWEGR